MTQATILGTTTLGNATRQGGTLFAAVGLLAAACSGDVDSAPLNQQSQDIIGGFSAPSEVLDHTGSLIVDDFGNFEPYCSATLIGDDAVITAKHCAEISFWGYDTYFGIGSDGYAPKELIRIAAVDTAPVDTGGFVGYGQDVGVLHLDHAPTEPVTPAVPTPSSELTVGTPMVSLGYGVFGAGGAFDGQRRIGRETVIATEGLTLEALFGDFESFVEWVFTGQVSDEDWLEILEGDPYLPYLLEIYESEVLLPGDEAATGTAPNDTQSCNGDSGSPLLRYEAGVGFRTYGVVSGGFGSARSQCDFGTVFATFGPELMAFIDEALAWEDPCGDVSTSGTCSNNVAQNCITDVSAGVRELVEQDCSETAQICVLFSGGAACGTPQNTLQRDATESILQVPLSELRNPRAADVGQQARDAVAEAFFYEPFDG